MPLTLLPSSGLGKGGIENQRVLWEVGMQPLGLSDQWKGGGQTRAWPKAQGTRHGRVTRDMIKGH